MTDTGKWDKNRRDGYEFENALLHISEDPGNALDIGSDDKLFVETALAGCPRTARTRRTVVALTPA